MEDHIIFILPCYISTTLGIRKRTFEYQKHLKSGCFSCTVFEWSISRDCFIYIEKNYNLGWTIPFKTRIVRKPDISGFRIPTVLQTSAYSLFFNCSEPSGYNLNGLNALPMDCSPTYPSAHTSIEIRYEPGRGRYGVAADDIPLGTTLIKETPITFALHPVSALDVYALLHCM